tara:strand:+ start:1108 stop:1404 length:297 start_codon:yes stop_codon:yes gene_type:complete
MLQMTLLSLFYFWWGPKLKTKPDQAKTLSFSRVIPFLIYIAGVSIIGFLPMLLLNSGTPPPLRRSVPQNSPPPPPLIPSEIEPTTETDKDTPLPKQTQ